MEDNVYHDPAFLCRDPVICHLAACFMPCGGNLINLQRSFNSLQFSSAKNEISCLPLSTKVESFS